MLTLAVAVAVALVLVLGGLRFRAAEEREELPAVQQHCSIVST